MRSGLIRYWKSHHVARRCDHYAGAIVLQEIERRLFEECVKRACGLWHLEIGWRGLSLAIEKKAASEEHVKACKPTTSGPAARGHSQTEWLVMVKSL